MGLLLGMAGVAVSLIGAHFAAGAVASHLIKTQKKWVAKTVEILVLLVSFAASVTIISMIIMHEFPSQGP